MMAMETTLDKNGVSYGELKGYRRGNCRAETELRTPVKLRDEVIEMGIILYRSVEQREPKLVRYANRVAEWRENAANHRIV